MNRLNEDLKTLWRTLDRVASHLPEDDTEPESLRHTPKRYELGPTADDLDEQGEHEEVEVYIRSRIEFNLSRRLRQYVEQRNLFKVQQILGELAALSSSESSEDFYGAKYLVDEAIEEIDNFEPVLLFSGEVQEHDDTKYTPKEEPLIILPKLIVRVKAELVNMLAKQPELLRSLSPREFEELMADVFHGFGYLVELTAPSKDGGKDIIAIRSVDGIVSKLLIECKRYVPPHKVDVGWVRQLYGVRQMEKATKALLATTSYFTRDARQLEAQHLYELELKDYDAVTTWVREYDQILKGGRSQGST